MEVTLRVRWSKPASECGESAQESTSYTSWPSRTWVPLLLTDSRQWRAVSTHWSETKVPVQSPKLPTRPILSEATVRLSGVSGASSPCSRAFAGVADKAMIPVARIAAPSFLNFIFKPSFLRLAQ